MALIDSDHVTSTDTVSQTYEDMLKNAKAILFEIDNAIFKIVQGTISSYSIQSGQGSHDTRKLSLTELRELRAEIISQIDDLEGMLGLKTNTVQVIPGW